MGRLILVLSFTAGLAITESPRCDTSSQHKASGVVYIVFCVDTETDGFNYGRFSQSLNLNSFKKGNIVDQALSQTWRDSLTDSFDGSLKISWFLMTIEGYRPTSHGINAVAGEFLRMFSDRIPKLGDEIGWHYHHSDWYHDSLSRKTGWNMIRTFSGRIYNRLSDRELAMSHLASFVYHNRLYPASFRAGWLWENNDFSNWLDSVIPFDYSNNWDAVDEQLFMYHPSTHDLFTPGDLSRSVVRAIDAVDSAYVRSMFELAAAGRPVILAYYTHNYGSTLPRNNAIKQKANRFHTLFCRYSDSLGVPFQYSTASEAVNRTRGIEMPSEYYLSVRYDSSSGTLYAACDSLTFGVLLVCIRIGGEIVGSLMEHDTDANVWRLRLDTARVDSFLVAGVSKTGETFVCGPCTPSNATAQNRKR